MGSVQEQWTEMRARAVPPSDDSPGAKSCWRVPLAALVAALVLALGIGLVALDAAKQDTAREVGRSLETIAHFKALQIDHWLDEAREPVERAAEAAQLAPMLSAWIAGGRQDGKARARIVAFLASRLQGTQYLTLSIHSADDGALLLSTGAESDEPATRSQALAALSEDEAVLQDFHSDPSAAGPVVRIGFFYPVRPAAGAKAIAVMHANIDPYRSLVPMVAAWPNLAATAEILFLRPLNGDFELLNSPADRPDIPPLTRLSGVAGGDALLTGEHNFSGRDYRGVPVFAYGAAVVETPWRLVAKLDVAEAYAHVDQLAAVTGVGIALLLCFGCAGWAMHNRHVLLEHRQQLDGVMLAKRINYLAKYANDCITLADLHGRLLEVNDRGCRLYGYTAEEMLGMPITQLRAPGHQEEVPQLLDRIAREGSLIYETVHRRKDGSLFPVEISTCLIELGGRRGFQAITRDISGRRRLEEERAEHQRRINDISHRLVAVQEQERRLLAAELHDRTGANLAAISLNLKAVSQSLPAANSQSCKEILVETGQLLTDTIASVRNICTDLRPAILDYAGLVAALMDLAANFSRRTGVVARVDHQAFHCQCPAEMESLLYRIVQEALNNCAKHAKAKNVEIRLASADGASVLTVSDDGRGFAPEELGQTGRGAGLGLLIIRERAEFMGGHLSVASRPGAGTQVKVEWTLGTGTDANPPPRQASAAPTTAA